MSDASDRARASVLVRVPIEHAFRVFTEDIDRWWRRGLKYRVSGKRTGILHLEPFVGGRLFESYGEPPRVFENGRVTRWEPPRELAFEWRAANFASHESTTVEVSFAPSASGTLVTVTHRGWASIRPDHPARHGHAPGPFLRMNGMWWGDLLTSLRLVAEETDPPRG
ncbi:MAG: SRPBCC domain-containing protein [Sandaracinaceae bacterium]